MLRRSRKTKARKISAKPRAALRRFNFNWLTLNRFLGAALALAALAGLVIGWVHGIPRLQSYASLHALALQSDDPVEVQVRFIDLPGWVKPDLRSMLADKARELISADPLARQDLVAARNALLETGWFERVDQVRRVGLNAIEIRGLVVDPFAYVRDRAGDHLVDRAGRLLPYHVPAGKGGLTVITGAHFPRPQRPMTLWDGEDLAAGLLVLRLIETRAWRDQVVSIDVSEYLKHERLRLVTNRSTEIIWGRAPGAERTGEVSAAQKLTYLDFDYESFGHIDRNCPRELDITGDVVTGR